MRYLRRLIASGGGPGLERKANLVHAGVRTGDESNSAQRHRDAVHQQPPPVPAVPDAFVAGARDGHVTQWWEYQRQERAGHGTHHRYEQAQVRYHVGGHN